MDSSVNFIKVPENYMQDLEVISARIEVKLYSRFRRETVVSHRGLSLTVQDLRDLLNREELINDEIINLYFVLIQERNVREHLQPVYVFDSLFYTSLERFGVEKSTVRTSTMKPVFDNALALMPCHLKTQNHWALIEINFIKRTITVYDSKFNHASADAMLIKRFLLSHIDKLGLRERFPDFSLCLPENIPKQKNLHDCGIFTMVYAEFLSRDVHPTNITHEAFYYRMKIYVELIGRKITARE